jgi:lipid-A-disaccharide synthase
MRYFIIAGEQSGDLHGSNLIRGLRSADPSSEIFCWGGELMEEAGGKLLMHYRRLAIMGFVAVVKNLGTIARNMKLCKEQIKECSPDVVILIDFPGFNLRIAGFAKNAGFRVFYYISPKLWAWKESRVEKIKMYVDRMFIIFPFEVDFYRKHNIDVQYYGNPLVDEIGRKKELMGSREDIRRSLGLDSRPVIGMLAGSRKGEIKHILPQMLKMIKHFQGYQFVLAAVQSIPESYYRKFIGDLPVKMITGKSYEIMLASEASLVKSGTSTLEAALLNTPQVVCYKGDEISFQIARLVVKIRVFSLVNLIMEREVVKELIQFLLTEENLVKELRAILPGGSGREKMLADYTELRTRLGPAGASVRIAEEMVEYLKGRTGEGETRNASDEVPRSGKRSDGAMER